MLLATPMAREVLSWTWRTGTSLFFCVALTLAVVSVLLPVVPVSMTFARLFAWFLTYHRLRLTGRGLHMFVIPSRPGILRAQRAHFPFLAFQIRQSDTFSCPPVAHHTVLLTPDDPPPSQQPRLLSNPVGLAQVKGISRYQDGGP